MLGLVEHRLKLKTIYQVLTVSLISDRTVNIFTKNATYSKINYKKSKSDNYVYDVNTIV